MRKKVFLNGEWDFMPIYDDPFCSELPKEIRYDRVKCRVPSNWHEHIMKVDKYGYDPMSVFNYPEEWKDAEAGVLHRKFCVPDEMKKERIFLGFDAVAHKSTVYLNGEKIASHLETFLPLYTEITGKVKMNEENDLYVVCCDYEESEIPGGQMKTTGLVGSWFGKMVRGIWQDAYLFSKPWDNISDYEIVTSVRQNKITIFTDIDASDEKGLVVRAVIGDKGKTVKTISQTVSGGQAVLSEEWKDAEYWDTENPHLYELSLFLERDGKITDQISSRFGFREFWADGKDFILNGTRVNLRGDSWHFQGAAQQTKEYAKNWCRICRQNGVNSIRYHAEPHPEYYLDAADEEGILIVDETAIYGSGKTMNAASESYIQNCREHIRRFVKRDKNHASVVIWSLQNEMRWVDGRDEYKKHVPELMDIFHRCDRSGRLISLDGDNRLIDKQHTEIASLHYNIDGTVDQWDRKTPLTIGEHGGLWYICPQNSSMYLGMGTYTDSDLCGEGISLKEQLFMEYARKEEVSGISSFNFAHYFARSMPTEDIPQRWDTYEGEGVKPEVIKKYSLTINNGHLPPEYPVYTENPSKKYAEEGMRPVTVFTDEYDHSFYDDKQITRHLYVFNDTLGKKDVTLIISANMNGKEIYKTEERFSQAPGKFVIKEISFKPCAVSEKTPLIFTACLYHGKTKMHTMTKEYQIYPASLKNPKIKGIKAAFFGRDEDIEIMKRFVADIEKTGPSDEITGDVLIVGSYIDVQEGDIKPLIEKYLKNGKNVIITEQFSYSFGKMILNKKEFIRAHASDYSHPVLSGITDNDLMFWYEKAYEYGPVPFIKAAFEKPKCGDYNMILECSFGDFGDGGDLWSPMMEYRGEKGTLVANQLQILKNTDTVPQAALILKNMIEYAKIKKPCAKSVSAYVNGKDKEFLDKIMIDCDNLSVPDTDADILIVSADKLSGAERIYSDAAFSGKKVVVLPAAPEHEDALSKLFGEKVSVSEYETYILKADYSCDEVKGVSVIDLFGFDHPRLSQRTVTNEKLGFYSTDAKGAEALIRSVEGTIWEDTFVNGYDAEFCKQAIFEFNKLNKRPEVPFMIKKAVGAGAIYSVQIKAETGYEKSQRFYTRFFDNLGAGFLDGCADHIKQDAENSLEMIMALPLMPYHKFERAFEYYSDPEFSLNNLGEGLYGWMKKTERGEDGYLDIADSENKTMFMTAFVHVVEDPAGAKCPDQKDYLIDISATRGYELYINGERITKNRITLKRGINRLFIMSAASEEKLRIRAVIKNTDNTYARDLLYRLTVDEVDPK